jgi:HK97 family phage prohead protease
MPYFITETNPECSGWAVVDEGDGYYGCHTTKQSAIDQAVAISISTEEPFEGERAAIDSLNIGDYVSWNPLDPEILAEIVAVEGQMAVIRIYEYEDGIFTSSDKLMIINVFKIERIERPDMVAEEFQEEEQPAESIPNDQPVMEEDRAINQDAPAYMRAAARRGLEYYSEGLGGDGLVDSTISDARLMADGTVSDEKWIRTAAWIARHLGDLDSPDANPNSDNFPSAGVVAHLLWGSGPSKASAQRALDYAESVVARIRAEESERMTEPVMDEARAKWLKAAYAIKAKIEGSDEARNLGKNEVRTNHIEMRAEGDGRTFTGYASVFNQPSQPLPFIEYVKPGAFKRSLQSRNRMMLLWNHDTSNPLASTRNGSLQLTEDNIGLRVTATLPDTTLGRDITELVRTGVIDSMSFGFSVKKDSWSNDGQTRYLEDVTLYEVSLVSSPAYTSTEGTVSVRSSISADALADALLKIESGEELDTDQGALVTEVIAKLTKTPEVQEVDGDILALKQKKLALLMMGI